MTLKTIFINSNHDLKLFVCSLQNTPYITIDTEFRRENTFWPELCLIQVASSETIALIDPLSPHLDLSIFHGILKDPKIVKVLHAAFEDMEIFLNQMGEMPISVFDTQIAAQFCGFGESVGYDTLIKSLCSKDIDKSQQRTDWTKRPLTEAQITYAVADVFYLRQAYEIMVKLLQKKGRLSWVKEEMSNFFVSKTFQRTGDEIWNRIKSPKETPKTRILVKELAFWREDEAKRLNLPRGWVLSDTEIITLSSIMPQTQDAFFKIKSLSRLFEKRYVGDIVDCIKKALLIPQALWPLKRVNLPHLFYENQQLDCLCAGS